MLPLSPPYDAATVVFCGGTWGYNDINGAPSLQILLHVHLAAKKN